jgi:hypothetical protein
LAWQQVVELLNGMSVVVGEGLPYSWSISADQQWLQVLMSDDPLQPNITEVTVDLDPVIPDTPLPAPPAMTVTACEPTSVAITDEDVMLIVTGAQFNPTTQIVLGGIVVETIAVSSVEVATVFSPPLAPGFGDLSVQVQDGTTLAPPSPSPIHITITSATQVTTGTAGLPGAWMPQGDTPPLNLAALTAATPPITAVPATAWAAGQYIVLGDQSEAFWNGTAWAAGRAVVAAMEAPHAPAPEPQPEETPA